LPAPPSANSALSHGAESSQPSPRKAASSRALQGSTNGPQRGAPTKTPASGAPTPSSAWSIGVRTRSISRRVESGSSQSGSRERTTSIAMVPETKLEPALSRAPPPARARIK